MKKPKKKYRPRDVLVNPLTLLQSASKDEQRRLLGRFYSALETITRGDHPGVDEWRDLSDALNCVETLALHMGKLVPAEVMPTVNAAIEGMVNASKRYKAGQGMRLDAAGLAAVRLVLDIYAQCIEGLTAHEMWRAQTLTARRVAQIQAAGRPDRGDTLVEL
jgi:hypothetical protein